MTAADAYMFTGKDPHAGQTTGYIFHQLPGTGIPAGAVVTRSNDEHGGLDRITTVTGPADEVAAVVVQTARGSLTDDSDWTELGVESVDLSPDLSDGFHRTAARALTGSDL